MFDLRGNGGGLVEEARLIASIFLPRGAVVVTTRGRKQPSQTLRAAGDPIPASVPVVVLVDRDTASASEIVTAALQDHRRATVVGTHTFGKGVFQEEQPLSNGGALDITVGEYFTPNGRNLGGGGVREGAGITPEVSVPARRRQRPWSDGRAGHARGESPVRHPPGSGAGDAKGATRDRRVVWPPQRRESAREAIEGLMRERGLARGFEGAVERAARKARRRLGATRPTGGRRGATCASWRRSRSTRYRRATSTMRSRRSGSRGVGRCACGCTSRM